ncbi:MAG: Spy/CpxP family protein refolding chaperone [Chromatiales bacterium]|nr:Spy/CpxP family protein refolding chaperone [Chromatiales bacterium]
MGIRDFLARHRRDRAAPGGWMLRRIGRKLDLDESQQQRLTSVQGRMQDLRAGMQAAKEQHRDALAALLSGERLDRAEAMRLLKVPAAVAAESAPELVAAIADFYDGLNAGQRTRLRELMTRRHGRSCRRH